MLDKRLGLVLGSELVTIPNINGVAIGGPSVTSYSTGGNTVTSGVFYKISFSVENYSGTGDVGMSSGSFGTSVRVSANGTFSFVAFATATATLTVFTRSTNTANFRNISVRELPGNHAYTPAAASTARPTVSARVNLLTKTEQFDDAAWTKSNITVTPNTDGVADTIVENLVNGFHNVSQNVASTTVSNTVRFRVKPAGRTWCWIQLGTFVAYFNLSGAGSTGTVNANLTASISPAIGATGYYDLVVSGTPASNICNFGLATADATASYAGDGTSGITITYADLRVTNDGVGIPAYQRVNTATDYDTVGFPVYLRADGSNDYMLTNSIDFSAGPSNPPLGSELRGSFSTALIGTATAATYNSSTGVGTVDRVDIANQSYVRITGLAANKYFKVTIQNTGANVIQIRQNAAGNIVATIVAGSSLNVYVSTAVFTDISITSNGGPASFVLNSVRELLDSSLAPDKMTLCAGVRKLSDAASGTLFELSSTYLSNNGTFNMSTVSAGLAGYVYTNKGTNARDAAVSFGYAAPITNVLTGIGDISGDSVILRINGAEVANSTLDQGTGNLGNYPLYMFGRNGASLFFNGRFYGSVGRGAQSNDQQIAALEGYMNTKTAAY
jgi:hypothetical protein